jgi:hypothetical protein
LIDMPGTASRFIPLKRAGAYPTTTGIRHLAQVLTEPQQRLRRQQRDVMAGGAIELHEIARSEIPDAPGVEGKAFRLPACVPGWSGFVNG